MSVRDSTSKKRSAASSASTQPPEQPVFFIDRCLGAKIVPDALRGAGFVVELHSAHFEHDVRDEVWIKSVGKRGWVILTKDRHIRSNQIEIEALMASGVPTFTLTTADTTGAQNAATILMAMPTMLRCIGKFKPPFVAGITRVGEVNIFMTHAQMIRRV